MWAVKLLRISKTFYELDHILDGLVFGTTM
jgi:hypothetical protein